MPFGYSGSSQPKRSNTDRARRRPSTASAASQSSHSSAKGSNSLDERLKDASSTSRSRGQSKDSASKSKTEHKKGPSVFDFLDGKNKIDEEASSSDSGDADLNGLAGAYPKSVISGPDIEDTTSRRSTTRGPSNNNNNNNDDEESSSDESVSSYEKENLDFSKKPEAYYSRHNHPAPLHQQPRFPPSPPKSPEENSMKTRQQRPQKNDQPSQVSSGYGYLASRLSTSSGDTTSDHLPPLYRRFEYLNHRVLLHLQDEIAQMEEQLTILDDHEEMHRVSTAKREGTQPMSASRRMDAQAQTHSTLYYRRSNLIEAVIQKTEQYNNALYAYSKVQQTLPRASEPDIQTYHSWMRNHKPIAITEARFLDHDKDLISLTPLRRDPSSSSSPSPSISPTDSASPIFRVVLIASTAILLPLLAFSVISEFSGRLIVVTIVGGAVAAVSGHYSTGVEQLVDSKNVWRGVMVYFGFMTVAAMFIP